MRKPRIFFSSSSEAGSILEHLVVAVTDDQWAIPQPWMRVFEPGLAYLESLVEKTSVADFAVILYTGEDLVESRGETGAAPRDNILFELGFFIGRLGPKRVLVVGPHPIPKLPSNYAGHKVLTYDPGDGPPEEYLTTVALQIRARFRQLWGEQAGAISTNQALLESPTVPLASNVTVEFSPAATGIIPIYRDLGSPLDWYHDFALSVQSPFPSLNPKMLYSGPGLARLWIRISREGVSSKMKQAFQRKLASLIDAHVVEHINIVDLGIGDFEKGRAILEHLLNHSRVAHLSYIPLDVSYEMLTAALDMRPEHISGEILQDVVSRGKVVAINSTFSQLSRYRHLLSASSRNIFLLLGNTLGNELDEMQTLSDIAEVMNEGDVLLVEIQALQERPLSTEESTKRIQAQKYFYAGPFIALGYPEDQIEVVVRRDERGDAVRGMKAVTFTVNCILKEHRTVHNQWFEAGQVRIPRAEVSVLIVRKYLDSFGETTFLPAGLEILSSVVTEASDPTATRFRYIVARKLSRSRPMPGQQPHGAATRA